MKTPLYPALCLVLLSCGSPLGDRYHVQFPELPPAWREVLGEARWRLEWRGTDGSSIIREIPAGAGAEIAVLAQWASPILAWPHWEEVPAGLFRPAGAIFPFDAAGETIVLGWRTGAEAFFYRELEEAAPGSAANRVPRFFDWPRFRRLLGEEGPEELREDPWRADFRDLAEKSVRSGFNKTRLKAEPQAVLKITMQSGGPWIWGSPFRPPGIWEEGERAELRISPRQEILVSPGGMFFLSPKTQLWKPW